MPVSSQAGAETERQLAISTWPRRRAHQRTGISSSDQHEPADARLPPARRAAEPATAKGHARELVLDQHARELALNLPRLDLIVEFGNFGQRVGGDQPDLAGAGIG